MAAELDPQRLATVQLVPLTPFSPDGGQILLARLQEFLGDLNSLGITVFLPGAGTSEFHSLSIDEIGQCVATTRKAVAAESLVIGPVGLGLPSALAMGRASIDAGADALIVMPPIHPYLSDEGLRDYYKALIDKLPVPFMVYKKGAFPGDELLLELAQSDQVVGIKYSSNDINGFTRFASECPKKTVLSCGLAERFAPSFMMAGARAFTSGAANLCPLLSLAFHRALESADYPQAMRRLKVLRPIEDFRARKGDSYNISMLKCGMMLMGRDFGPARPPMRTLTEQEKLEVERTLLPILAYEAEMTHAGLKG